MSDINTITLIGICGKDPEFVTFENDTKLTKFTMAVKRYDRKSKSDITDWFDIKTFSKLGEYIKKGARVAVCGKLQTNTWQNKEGKTIKNYDILADEVQILTPKKQENQNNELSMDEQII